MKLSNTLFAGWSFGEYRLAAMHGTHYQDGAVAAVHPMKVTIARVETFPVTYPTVGWFKFLEGPKGRPGGRASVVVKITADNGAVGWGQSVPAHRWSYETLETVQTTIQNYLAPELVGLVFPWQAGFKELRAASSGW